MSQRRLPWLSGSLRKLVRNAGILLSGQIAAQGLQLLTLLLVVRAMDPAALGLLQLVQNYAKLVESLFSFQSWQALIKYGTEALDRDCPLELQRLLKGALLLDGAVALLAAGGGAAGAWLLGGIWHWSSTERLIAAIYTLSLCTRLSGLWEGVFRLFRLFRAQAILSAVGALVRFAVLVVLFLVHANPTAFYLGWMVGDVVSNLVLLGGALVELHRLGHGGFWRHPVRGLLRDHEGLAGFVVTTSLSLSVRTGSRCLDTLLIGALLPREAVALFGVAKQIALIPARVVQSLYQVIYPDLARLCTAGDIAGFKQLMRSSAKLVFIPSVVAWGLLTVAGRPLLALVGGTTYAAAYPVLVTYGVGVIIALTTFAFQPAMLSLGRPGWALLAHLGSTALYLALLYVGLRTLGLTGAGLAFTCYHLAHASVMARLLARLLRVAQSPSPEPGP